MANSAHRSMPALDFHGGSAAAARHAVLRAQRERYEQAQVAATTFSTKDRRRPRACGRPTSGISTLVWERCNSHCEYCGELMLTQGEEPRSFTVDHMLPRSRGGTNQLDNLAGACRACNGEKGSLTDIEYRRLLVGR